MMRLFGILPKAGKTYRSVTLKGDEGRHSEECPTKQVYTFGVLPKEMGEFDPRFYRAHSARYLHRERSKNE